MTVQEAFRPLGGALVNGFNVTIGKTRATDALRSAGILNDDEALR